MRSRTCRCRRRARVATRIVLTNVMPWKGRSSKVTLALDPKSSKSRRLMASFRELVVKTMTGTSDHGGCFASASSRMGSSSGMRASSATKTALVDSSSSCARSTRLEQILVLTSTVLRTLAATCASPRVGVSNRTIPSTFSSVGMSARSCPLLSDRLRD